MKINNNEKIMKQIKHMKDAFKIINENQAWINKNAKKKAEKYKEH